MCLMGMVALAVATLTVRTATSGGNLLMIVGMQMLVGAAVLGVIALGTETWEVTWTPRLGLAFAYTTLVPGLLATWVWFRLVGRIGAVRAATFHFLNPFFGGRHRGASVGRAPGAVGHPGRRHHRSRDSRRSMVTARDGARAVKPVTQRCGT